MVVNAVAAANPSSSSSIVEFDMGPLTAKPHQVDDDTKRTTPLCEEEDYTSVSASVSPPDSAPVKEEEADNEKQQRGGDQENDDEASEISSLCGIEQGFVDDVEASIRSLEQSVLPNGGGSTQQQQNKKREDEDVSNGSTPLQNGGGAAAVGAVGAAGTGRDLLVEESVSSRYRDYKLRPPTPELPTSLLGPEQQQQLQSEENLGSPLSGVSSLTSSSQMAASTGGGGGGRRARNGSTNSAASSKPSFNAFLKEHKQQRKKSVFEKNMDYIEGEVIKRASTLERNINYIKQESQGKLLREFSLHGGGIPPVASSSSLHGAAAAAGTQAIREEDSLSMSSRSTRSVMMDVKDTAASAATTFSRNLDYIRAGGLLTEYDSEEEELEDCDNLSTEVSSFIHARARVFTRNIGTLLNVPSLVKPTPTRTKTDRN